MATAELLKRSPELFKALSPANQQQLLDGSQVRSFEANEVIVHQGVATTHLGVILDGTVSVVAVGDGGQPAGSATP